MACHEQASKGSASNGSGGPPSLSTSLKLRRSRKFRRAGRTAYICARSKGRTALPSLRSSLLRCGHARNKLLRVTLLSRTSRSFRSLNEVLLLLRTLKKDPSKDESFFMVAGRGLEPLTSWL